MKPILLWIAGIVLLVVLAVAALVISNRNLPTHSNTVEHLSDEAKAHLAEAFHLHRTLGGAIWPGWDEGDIPIIVYNESYAFLVGYSGEPPAGWVKVPQDERRGGDWEIVPGDTFEGQPYYRTPLPNPTRTPENFTVLVGEHWVATMQTKEYAAIAFYQGFREELPDPLRPIFPYRLFWNLIIDSSETYVGGLLHEAFHAYQGITARERLTAAESVASLEGSYPWENESLETVWKAELELLHRALKADTEAEAADLARQFLAEREARRAMPEMAPSLVTYERQREWLEGLAKYAELSIQRQAARSKDYEPVPAIAEDEDFKDYATRERFYARQISEIQRMQNREGETRFYYSGMAQAALLDRLMPGWKARAWEEDVWLDALLAEALSQE